MGRHILVAFLLISVVFSSVNTATEGRAAPQCAEFDLSDVASSTSGVAVEPGACLIVNLGSKESQTKLSIDIEIMDDEMDVLLFDQNGISVYKNGQNYRSSFVPEGTFESIIGERWFDWSTPTTISERTWYFVFDNTAHDGDQGMGDQGGMISKFTIDVQPVEQEDFSLVLDTFYLQPSERLNMIDFAVDYGTGLDYWVHPLSGTGEFFIQSDNQLGGDLKLSGSSFSQLVDDKNYATWTVPEYLDMKNLNLMVDAGEEGFHFSIGAWFSPVLSPTVVNYVNGTTTIGESIILDASNSPNSLNQISSISWDFDSDEVSDAEGFIVQASWDTPGSKTVNLTVVSSSGEVAIVSHQITVNDVTNPVAVISGSGTRGIDGEWRLLRLSDLVLQSSNSYDDHKIESVTWSVDGTPMGSSEMFTVSWSEIGTYKILLTVADPTGNTNSSETMVVVYDSTIPSLEMSSIKEISQVNQGENVEFNANAVDLWDEDEDLIFTWDLDLEKDSNGDGDLRNDADYTGRILSVSFEKTGEYSIGLTVYDASNNTDFEIFTFKVVEGPSSANLFAIVSVVFFVIIVVAGVVLFGYRGAQRKHAIEMLLQNNFTYEQATARINEIAKTTKLPPFAKAEQIAGIVEGGQLKTPEQIMSETKAAEMAQIYGNDSLNNLDPNAGFRPQYQQTASVNQAAQEALAAFADERPMSAEPTPKSGSGKVRSGGVALPGQTPVEIQQPTQKNTTPPPPQSHNLVGDCTACGQKFSVNMPQGVNNAVVSCPSCSSDQLFER